ncbi:Hypothetical_protein [Hexamita inflata]|uniref:Hypothetical_protein n=1 Tax=Hexamita inflata TaxID=28002 RepID=A0AA86Q070_9EUKA|nr:Hypothetical protein HINF_LOCUS32080 [Hexamita inflata]
MRKKNTSSISKRPSHLSQMFSIDETDEPSDSQQMQSLVSVAGLRRSLNLTGSSSCDVLWDESSRNDVLMKKIKVVEGRKRVVDIFIDTSSESFSKNVVEQDEYDIYNYFNDVKFM